MFLIVFDIWKVYYELKLITVLYYVSCNIATIRFYTEGANSCSVDRLYLHLER